MMLEDLYRLLKAGHVQAQGVVDTMTQPIIVLDRGFTVATANNAFLKAFEISRDEIVGVPFFDLGNGQWDIPELRQLISEIIPRASTVVGYKVKHDFPVIGRRTFLIDAKRLVHPDDNSNSILIIFDDITERERHDAERELVVSEVRHRMRNMLSIVKSLARQTETEGRSASEYRDVFLGRLEVTLRAQEIAASTDAIKLYSLIQQSIGAFAAERLRFEGPDVLVSSSNVVAISMIFHELATNAAKYGAMCSPDGEVILTCALAKEPASREFVTCEWRELNGPPTQKPTHSGYGTSLINATAKHIGGCAELEYEPQGLVATITFPL